MVKILDCTTRDGGRSTNWMFKDSYICELIEFLNKNSTDYYEIGYRNNLEKEGKGKFFYCAPETLKFFYSIKGNLKLGIMVDTSRYSISDFSDAKNDYIDFVRIATHPEKIKETLHISQELHKKGYSVFIQLMEIPNVKEEHYEVLSEWENKDILESLYIADSYSTVKPEEIKKYFSKLSEIGYSKISFHAHNGNGLALENTIEAINCGAFSVDVSQNGLGGNLDFELLKRYLK